MTWRDNGTILMDQIMPLSYWLSYSFDKDIWLPPNMSTRFQEQAFGRWQRLHHLLWQTQQSENIASTVANGLPRPKEREDGPQLLRKKCQQYFLNEDIRKLENISIFMCLYKMHSNHNGNLMKFCNLGHYENKP